MGWFTPFQTKQGIGQYCVLPQKWRWANYGSKISSCICYVGYYRCRFLYFNLLNIWWKNKIKSHNMKALVILSHSWLPFVPLTGLYGKNYFCGSLCRFSGVFSWEKTPLRSPMQITWPWPQVDSFNHGLITVRQKKMWWENFTKSFLSNIINHGEGDVQWQSNI